MEDNPIGLKESPVLDVKAPAWTNSAVRADSEVEIRLTFIQPKLFCVAKFKKTNKQTKISCEET